ncbi:MAG: helix-hairpin-helix domain-containing protein [Anaerolineae bacterium]|nr:helix-hairpin-helix domain-containing protein [Anaerolineae bacterium]
MATDAFPLTIWVTKPNSAPSLSLAGMEADVRTLEEDEGNVDRYVLSSQVAVERRAGTTFVQGIEDKSLFLSAIYLREHFETPVFILEGDALHAHTGFNPQAVRGALSALMLEYGVSVVSTHDSDETAHLLAMMARHAQTGVPEISLVPKRKAVDLPDLQRRVVEMLPGCGRVTARDLLQHFGSVDRIAAATERELQQVRGIGKKRATEIIRVLRSAYEAVDTERNLEDAIEAAPWLLFDYDVELVARQHAVTMDQGDRHILDLVTYAPDRNELILVELKRGALNADHETQLKRYFGVARESALLRNYLDRGATLRGILATFAVSDYVARDPDIDAVVVDERAVIGVLSLLRQRRGLTDTGV